MTPSFGISPALPLSQPSILSLGLRGSEAISGGGRGDSLSPMSTSPPCHPSYSLKSTTTLIQPSCTAMSQVPEAGRRCSPVPRKVLAVSQGGHHCCSLVRKGQGFWEATHAHGLEGGQNDATTWIRHGMQTTMPQIATEPRAVVATSSQESHGYILSHRSHPQKMGFLGASFL